MTKIKNITAMEVLDSRGKPTVEVDLLLDNGITTRAIAPSGKSTGEHEAVELRDKNPDYYLGDGVQLAVLNVNMAIVDAIAGMDISDQKAIDNRLETIDSSRNFANLGANATTAVSMACIKAAAADMGVPLYEHLGGDILPIPSLNVINGGKHAGSALAIQEFMIMPIDFHSFKDAIRAGAEVYHYLNKIIETTYGKFSINVGDEGGFAPNISDTREAIQLLETAINDAGYSKQVYIAMDCAATSFYDKTTGKYNIDGLQLNTDWLIEHYAKLVQDYPRIVSIEDPLYENDFEGFTKLTARIGNRVQIVADDLTVTQLAKLKRAYNEKSANSILIKVNQNGTISGAQECVRWSQMRGWGVMLSHRSGETEDTTIADLAVGWNTEQLKSGAPCRGERTAKYNELMRIERQLQMKGKGRFAGQEVMARSDKGIIRLSRI